MTDVAHHQHVDPSAPVPADAQHHEHQQPQQQQQMLLVEHPDNLLLQEQQRMILALRAKVAVRRAELEEVRGSITTHDDVVRATANRGAHQVAAEDAVDHILRLEALLKLERRRNDVLLAKENATQAGDLEARRMYLVALKAQADELYRVTGYNPKNKNIAFRVSREELHAQAAEMAAMEQTLLRNQRAAQLIISKKQATIVLLEQELAHKREAQEQLHTLYNDVRVRDREVQEQRAKLEGLKAEDNERCTALAVRRDDRDDHAFRCIQDDTTALKTASREARTRKADLDALGRAQQARIDTLKARLGVVAAAMHDLGIDRARLPPAPPMRASIDAADEAQLAEQQQQDGVSTPLRFSTNALTVMPGASPVTARASSAGGSSDDATDAAIRAAFNRAAPRAELIAPEFYDLLQRDLEEMRGMQARKDIITFEKQLVVDALSASVQEIAGQVDAAERQRVVRRNQQGREVGELEQLLQMKNEAARTAIDELLTANQHLRRDARQRTAMRVAVAPPASPDGAAKRRMKF
jgi:hypothetical protein